MRPSLRMLAVGLTAMVAFTACGGDDDDDVGADTTSDTTVAESDTTEAPDTSDSSGTSDTTLASEEGTDEPATLGIGEAALGAMLVDTDGLTLYVFDNDTDGTSACTDVCATAWPPLTVEGDPVVGDDVTGEITTITRADGTTQVAVNGMPLYRFSGDQQPGDTTGLGVGGVWWPVSPAGEKLTG